GGGGEGDEEEEELGVVGRITRSVRTCGGGGRGLIGTRAPGIARAQAQFQPAPEIHRMLPGFACRRRCRLRLETSTPQVNSLQCTAARALPLVAAPDGPGALIRTQA